MGEGGGSLGEGIEGVAEGKEVSWVWVEVLVRGLLICGRYIGK